MKKLGYIVTFFLLVFSMVFNMSFAQEKIIEKSFVLDGKNVKLPITQINLDGIELAGDVPPVILNDRTLVPVRLISENLGAKVSWDSKEYKVMITKDNKNITLKIDSAKVAVDGKEKILPDKVPAKLISDRTMVPVRFVSEELGVKVDWDSKNRAVLLKSNKDIKNVIRLNDVTMSSNEIKLKLSENVKYTDVSLTNPDRLVLDLENTKMATLKDTYEGGTFFKTIRISQFKEDPLITRVVIDLNSSSEYKVIQENKELTIQFKQPKNNTKFEFKENNEKENFVIYRDLKGEYKTFYLSSPNRLVVDLYGSTLENDNGGKEQEINKEYLKNYKTYYHENEGKTRVTLTLKENIDTQKIKITEEGNNIRILFDFEKAPPINIKNKNLKYEAEGNNFILTVLQNNSEKAESIEFDEWYNKIKIKIKNTYVDLEKENINVEDNYVKNIEIDTDSDYTYVFISIKSNVLYNVLEDGKNKLIKIKLSKNEPIKQSGKPLIVLDPGHGGSAPGAISPIDKTKEKDLTLSITKKLNDLLKENGYDTLMTREEDANPSLTDRSDLANSNNATIFISIHINSIENKESVKGIETLYYPNDGQYAYGRDNKSFASIVQKELIKETKAVDRKIVSRPNLAVLKNTKMPAVLIECGFLTNNEELELMKSSEYQEKLAGAVYNGIKEYFDENGIVNKP